MEQRQFSHQVRILNWHFGLFKMIIHPPAGQLHQRSTEAVILPEEMEKKKEGKIKDPTEQLPTHKLAPTHQQYSGGGDPTDGHLRHHHRVKIKEVMSGSMKAGLQRCSRYTP